MSEEIKERYRELRIYFVAKYWNIYLSAMEKKALQSCCDSIDDDYKQTPEEDLAVLLLTNKLFR